MGHNVAVRQRVILQTPAIQNRLQVVCRHLGRPKELANDEELLHEQECTHKKEATATLSRVHSRIQ
jgi:hypothetical protein